MGALGPNYAAPLEIKPRVKKVLANILSEDESEDESESLESFLFFL